MVRSEGSWPIPRLVFRHLHVLVAMNKARKADHTNPHVGQGAKNDGSDDDRNGFHISRSVLVPRKRHLKGREQTFSVKPQVSIQLQLQKAVS